MLHGIIRTLEKAHPRTDQRYLSHHTKSFKVRLDLFVNQRKRAVKII
jgi:hypothetical protein